MAKKKTEGVKITDTKKTKREKLIEEATNLGLEFTDKATIKQLNALIKTEKLKADLPALPPPPPAISFKKLKNKDVIVKIEPGKGARVLQGQIDERGEDKWVDLSIISPPGSPHLRIVARKKVKKLRLMLKKEELETVKI